MNKNRVKKLEKKDLKVNIPKSGLERFLEGVEIPVKTEEVKRSFLIADEGKGLFKQRGDLKEKDLLEFYNKIVKEYKELPGSELDKRIKDKNRLERYNNLNWVRKIVRPEELGVWSRFHGTDPILCRGSVKYTADMLSKIINKESKLIPEKTREKILSIGKNIDFVYPNFPIMVVPGGTIRGHHKEYQTTRHDIDDGSNRAVAFTLKGKTRINAYVGKKQHESSLN